MPRLPLLLTLLALSLSGCASKSVDSSKAPPGEGFDCYTLPKLFSVYLEHHYVYRAYTPELQKRFAESLVEKLDATRTILLPEEIRRVEIAVKKVDPTSFGDACQLSRDIRKSMARASAQYLEQLDLVLKAAASRPASEKDLLAGMRESERPRNAAEQAKRLTSLAAVQFDALRTLGTTGSAAAIALREHERLRLATFTETDERPLLELMAEAFAQALDPGSTFFSSRSIRFSQLASAAAQAGTESGIGVSVAFVNGFPAVGSLEWGSNLSKTQRIRRGDIFLAVAGSGSAPVPLMGSLSEETVKKLRGTRGSTVKLAILRPYPAPKLFTVELPRENAPLDAQGAKIEYVTQDTGSGKKRELAILRAGSFYGPPATRGRSTYEDLKDLLHQAADRDVGGIVLDLSENSGGLLDQMSEIGGLFLGPGPVALLKIKDSTKVLEPKRATADCYGGPLVLLTSRFTAAGAEVLAGTLRASHRALIVGADHTAGAATVAAVSGTPIGAMKVTVGMLFLPDGSTPQLRGVPADLPIDSGMEAGFWEESSKKRALPAEPLARAVDASSRDVAETRCWTPIRPELSRSLEQKARSRKLNPGSAEEVALGLLADWSSR